MSDFAVVSQPPAKSAGAPDRMPSRRVWESSYLITFPVTIAVIMLSDGMLSEQALSEGTLADGGLHYRLGAAGLVAVIGGTYAALRHRIDAFSPTYQRLRALSFNVGALLAFAVAVRLEFWTGIVLTALIPMAFLTLGLILGHVFMVALALLPSAAELARSGDLAGTVIGTLPWSAATIAFSIFVARAIAGSERRSAERAQLVAELRATREQAAQLAREAGAAEERHRLAGDLHDTVTQGLSSIAMLVEAADRVLGSDPEAARQHLSTAVHAARDNLHEARALVGALGPAPLAGSTLVDALRRISLGERGLPPGGRGLSLGGPGTYVPVRFEVVGAIRPLPTEVEVALLRIAQESLTNVNKHAGAAQAWLTVRFGDATITLELRDDGHGFDQAAPTVGYGVAGMRDRMKRAGGTLAIHSGPDGTTVRAEIPAPIPPQAAA